MSLKQLTAPPTSLVLPSDLVEVYSSTVQDPVPRHVLYPSIAEVQCLATRSIAGWEAYIEAIDRQPPLTPEYIASETRKAYRRTVETQAILARLFAFYFAIEQLPSEHIPREMTVTLEDCLADAKAMATKLFNRQLYARLD